MRDRQTEKERHIDIWTYVGEVREVVRGGGGGGGGQTPMFRKMQSPVQPTPYLVTTHRGLRKKRELALPWVELALTP